MITLQKYESVVDHQSNSSPRFLAHLFDLHTFKPLSMCNSLKIALGFTATIEDAILNILFVSIIAAFRKFTLLNNYIVKPGHV